MNMPTTAAMPVATATPAPRSPPLVIIEDIVQEYPNGAGVVRVVDGVSLAFDKPGINMLLGPSGCGKSTLLRMMGGVRPYNVLTPTTGRVTIDGKACTAAHDDAVMVFQHYANRPDLTVQENVAFPFRLSVWKKRVSAAEGRERVAQMLREVGLYDKKDLYPAQLSGGQNQRIALARALVLRPRILLMDEPFGALDAQTRESMQQLLLALHKAHPCLVIFVTHDVTEALLLGDRVLVLSTQPARIIDDFKVDAPHPRSRGWLLGDDARTMSERVLAHLRTASHTGSMRVSI